MQKSLLEADEVASFLARSPKSSTLHTRERHAPRSQAGQRLSDARRSELSGARVIDWASPIISPARGSRT